MNYTFSGAIRKQDQENLKRELVSWERPGVFRLGFYEKISRFIALVVIAIFFAGLCYNLYTSDIPPSERAKAAQYLIPILVSLLFYNSWKIWCKKRILTHGSIQDFQVKVLSSEIISLINGKIIKSIWSEVKRCKFSKDCLVILDNASNVHFLPLRFVESSSMESFKSDVRGATDPDNIKNEGFINSVTFSYKDFKRIGFIPEIYSELIKQSRRRRLFFLAGIVLLFVPFIVGQISTNAAIATFFLVIILFLSIGPILFLRSRRLIINSEVKASGIDLILNNHGRIHIPWIRIDNVKVDNSNIHISSLNKVVCVLPQNNFRYFANNNKYIDADLAILKIQKWKGKYE